MDTPGRVCKRWGKGEQVGHSYFLADDRELSGSPMSPPSRTEVSRKENEARKMKSW